MTPTSLNTNEVKSSAGTEIEFSQFSVGPGRTATWQQVGELPNLEHRLKISHQELGSANDQRRRSQVRVDRNVVGASGTPRTISFYVVADIPIGDVSDYDTVKDALAELMSFVASTGATTTILYNCTGHGATALVNGTL
jgi:hypothetical protein